MNGRTEAGRCHHGRAQRVLEWAPRCALAVGCVLALLAAAACDQQAATVVRIQPGQPVEGKIGPSTPMGRADKPVIDYELGIAETGSYRIDLMSSDTKVYNPMLVLLQGTNALEMDHDSGEGDNAQITRTLDPGTYTLRVTRYDIGRQETEAGFTLSVVRAE